MPMASASRWRSDYPATPTPSPRGRGRGRGRGQQQSRESPSTPSRSSEASAMPFRASSRPPVTPQSSPSRRMDLMASVSRSGGIEKDGDDLKDENVQEEYRVYIQGKLDAFWSKYVGRSEESDEQARQRVEAQENLLILFRKLREGIIASKRVNAFSDEVYASSLYLSILFDSPRNTSAIVPVVLSYLRSRIPPQSQSQSQSLALICLLERLVTAYPSQSDFHTSLTGIPTPCFPPECAERRWVRDLARYLGTGNYTRLERTLRRIPALEDPDSLAGKATRHLVAALQSKARESAWRTIRSAYREVTLEISGGWLLRSLFLVPPVREDEGLDARMEGLGLDDMLERWLEGESRKGNVVKKEEGTGKWGLSRPR
ncbi:hypothetical protein HMN09_00977800 [Mycena chlorophos]|uniref:Uncharacterized protein n=1 Tax=Mycena chlorophos TaxID=658473 RepID=A0A8H6SHG3_MYCCL|nr:hypothetical protein HMN09_00977800 [Mycena chlorophos]